MTNIILVYFFIFHFVTLHKNFPTLYRYLNKAFPTLASQLIRDFHSNLYHMLELFFFFKSVPILHNGCSIYARLFLGIFSSSLIWSSVLREFVFYYFFQSLVCLQCPENSTRYYIKSSSTLSHLKQSFLKSAKISSTIRFSTA